jgi:hypothetical protein
MLPQFGARPWRVARWILLVGSLLVCQMAAAGAPAHALLPAGPAAQGTPKGAPPMRDLAVVAAETVALTRANGGATVNLYEGDLSGRSLYVVVVYPDLTEFVAGADLVPAVVRRFIERHLALLADPRNNVGTYYDAANDRIELDVSTALPDRAQALALARRYNQAHVFDLATLTAIDAGGSGAVPADLPPLGERLPAPTPSVPGR